ncbi:hypothetical protein ACI782_06675 [Geodermatophilus sp. SYSU D00703]
MSAPDWITDGRSTTSPQPTGWMPYAPGEPSAAGWGAAPQSPPPTPPVRRRLRRALLIGGVLLAVLASVVAFVGVRAATSGPATPREAVQAFIDAGNAEDWSTSWDLLCHRDQLTLGPRANYFRERAAAAEETAALRAGMHITVGDVRYDDRAAAHAVELVISPDDGSPPVEMLVVEEDGALRICGVR